MERIQDSLLTAAARHPEKEAVIVDGQAMSYDDLVRGVAAVALYLERAGAKPGDRIAFESDNKLSFIQTFFGVVSVGGVAVPIAEGAGGQSVSEILSRTNPKFFLSDRAPARAAGAVPLADASADVPHLSAAAAIIDRASIGDRSPALIMFTSGTTARKKGVILSHANLCRAAANINAAMCVDETIREYVTIPLHHSFGLGRVRCVIAAGGTLAVTNGPFSPLMLARTVKQCAANALSAVPAVLGSLIECFGPIVEDFGAQIRVVEIGSAHMPLAHKERLLRLLPNARIFMHYGLTEASRSSFIEFRSQWSHIDTVGRPSPNVSITIRDDLGRLVPTGQSGEIVITGQHVCEGYLEDPELQSHRFRDGSFFTGDFGRLDAEGFLTLMGRKDDMINYGGIKLSPVEIEGHLDSVLKGCEFAVLGLDDPNGLVGEIPALAWAPTARSRELALDNKKIASLADTVLDRSCLPRQIVEVARIPKTANGKIKRAELRELLARHGAGAGQRQQADADDKLAKTVRPT
jgi:long-chain acyl-CoA synthetase